MPLLAVFGGLGTALAVFGRALIYYGLLRLVTFFGVASVSYVGFEYIVDDLFNYIFSHFALLPADLSAYLKIFGVYSAMSMYAATFSAILTWRISKKALAVGQDYTDYIT